MNFRIPTPIKFKDMKFHQKKQLFSPKLALYNKLHLPSAYRYAFFWRKLHIDRFYYYICLINFIQTEKLIPQ